MAKMRVDIKDFDICDFPGPNMLLMAGCNIPYVNASVFCNFIGIIQGSVANVITLIAQFIEKMRLNGMWQLFFKINKSQV